MPWDKIEDVPDNLKHYGLKKANKWAEIYDSVKAKGNDERKAAAIASAMLKENK